MKTKNHIEQQKLLELANDTAANEEGFVATRGVEPGLVSSSWSPLEVWRTRVKPANPAIAEKPLPR